MHVERLRRKKIHQVGPKESESMEEFEVGNDR